MDNSNSLKQIIQSVVPKDTALLQATVTSVSPIQIQMVNDAKHTASVSVIVPEHLTDYTTTATLNGGNIGEYSTSNIKITIHNALSVGDTVHVLQLNAGKTYLIIDRV